MTVAVAGVAPSASSAAPGDLDPTFGGDGRVTVDIEGDDLAKNGALTPEGNIVIAGEVNVDDERNVGIRVTPDGSPDPDFAGGAGMLADNPSPTADDFVEDVYSQDGGKILVGGTFGSQSGLMRRNSDGLPDSSFGTDGLVRTEG